MFALHRQIWSLATRFVFGVAAMLVVALACVLFFQTAKAQVRVGIGVGGIGGLLLDDALRRQQNQNANSENEPTKKAAKARNRKPGKDNTKTAKRSPLNGESSPEKRPTAGAPPTTPATPGMPRTAGTRPTADDFGD